MANPPTILTPDITLAIDQTYFLRPIGGPRSPLTYLDRFPESVYNKSLDSHLVKLMYALLGPSGVGGLRKQYLQARLLLEDSGLETSNLDDFYGDPIGFGRILEESYDETSRSLLSRAEWEVIRAKDAKYRNRAIDFVNGARAGNTPQGMHLVARSGLGHECEIIECYRYIYDQYTDDKLGLTKYGVTDSTEEIVVMPRRELPRSALQVLTITGSPTAGTFTLYFPVGDESQNTTQGIAWNETSFNIQRFLESVASIGVGNIRVTGGPLPDNPINIFFTGNLADNDVPRLIATSSLTGGTSPLVFVELVRSGVNQIEEVAAIGPRDKRYLASALDRVKPMTCIITYGKSPGLSSYHTVTTAVSTSQYTEVLRFVTGQTQVDWPTPDGVNWIEKGVEKQAPRSHGDLQYHHYGFHNIGDITSYTEEAVASADYSGTSWAVNKFKFSNNHIGPFSPLQRFLFPVLNRNDDPTTTVYDQNRALADYSEPLIITATTSGGVGLVNGIYPVEYSSLPGVPVIKYNDDRFWGSRERESGTDYLEIDLGKVQVVNYLYLEVSKKPYQVTVDYDTLDESPSRNWRECAYLDNLPSDRKIDYSPGDQNSWQLINLHVGDELQQPIYTRYLRIAFEKFVDTSSPFVGDGGKLIPYSVEVRNLRVARNVV
jgi:hypothetical protein